LHHSKFSCFDTIPACDRLTDTRTNRHTMTAYTALAQRRLVKMNNWQGAVLCKGQWVI